MINFLRKIFIKDYENVTNPKVRDSHAVLATILGIISNIILVIIKLFSGFVSGSVAIIGDGLNNLTDTGSSIITLAAFKMSSRPADKDHPYGHERIEYVSGLIVSIIIIVVSIELFMSSLTSLIENKRIEITIVSLIILGVSILIKLVQGYSYHKLGKTIDSLALKANARDSINDAISTTVILIGSIFIYLYPNMPFALDGLLGIFVAIFIFISGLEMIKETINPLIGINPKHEFIKTIIEEIKAYPSVLGVHDVRCHMYGPTKFFMTLHVEIPANIEFLKAHDEIDNIERDIRKKYGVDLTIHMDPIETERKDVLELKSRVEAIIKGLDLSFHDFRVVNGDTHTNILFDIVLPHDYKLTPNEIKTKIEEEFKDDEHKYYFIIDFDGEYIDQI